MSLFRLLALYQHARPEEREEGFFWYDTAGLEVRRLAHSYDFSYHVVAGVLAALSPGTSWEQALRDAEEVLATVDAHTVKSYELAYVITTEMEDGLLSHPLVEALDEIKTTSYKVNRDKAITIAVTRQVFPTLRGAKVETFYHNLCGDYSEPAIDTHAINAYHGSRVAGNGRALTYDLRYRRFRAIRKAYIQAAMSS
jgi:hypothetical protein